MELINEKERNAKIVDKMVDIFAYRDRIDIRNANMARKMDENSLVFHERGEAS